MHEILLANRSHLALSKKTGQWNWPKRRGYRLHIMMPLRKHPCTAAITSKEQRPHRARRLRISRGGQQLLQLRVRRFLVAKCEIEPFALAANSRQPQLRRYCRQSR